jgi:beta-galactosidase/beta-glucuronidase
MMSVFRTLTLLSVLLAFCRALLASGAGANAEETRVPLDGTWRIQPAGGEEREIPVPRFWERSRGLANVHEATYRREFEVPESFAGRRVLLRFDAVGDAAEVSLNGQHAGGHVGACLPFEVDITGLVATPSTSNQLSVLVQDDTHFSVLREGRDRRNRKSWIPRGMGANNRKGLYQAVYLVARPVVNVADARICTSVRRQELTVAYELFNGRRENIRAQLSSQVVSPDGAVVFTLPPTNFDLSGFVTTTVTLTASFKNVELWQPDHPTLYTLHTVLADGSSGASLHRKSTRFGFRETWFDGIHFYLNGIRCNLRGESPAYAEKVELFATRETATEMIRRYQGANCNVLRFHSMPAPPHVLDVCDELGMLVIDESDLLNHELAVKPAGYFFRAPNTAWSKSVVRAG